MGSSVGARERKRRCTTGANIPEQARRRGAALQIECRGEHKLSWIDDAVGVRCAVGKGADRLESVAGFLKIADVELIAGVDPVGPKSGAVAHVQIDGVTGATSSSRAAAAAVDNARTIYSQHKNAIVDAIKAPSPVQSGGTQ